MITNDIEWGESVYANAKYEKQGLGKAGIEFIYLGITRLGLAAVIEVGKKTIVYMHKAFLSK